MRLEGLRHINARFVDELSELSNLAHLFESEDLILAVAIYR